MSIYPVREILTPSTEKYLEGLLRPRDEVLSHLERDAEKNGVPIVGPLVGNFLSLLATAGQARSILEVGTATGYSGIWLGRVAKKNGGKLITIESDPARQKIASKSFRDAGLSDSIEIIGGDARKEVPKIAKKMEGQFDVTFIDVGDKTMYVDLMDYCASALRIGGFLIADNTLWNGYVGIPSHKESETATIREFNERIYADKRFQPVIVPLRDGVTVAIKLREK